MFYFLSRSQTKKRLSGLTFFFSLVALSSCSREFIGTTVCNYKAVNSEIFAPRPWSEGLNGVVAFTVNG